MGRRVSVFLSYRRADSPYAAGRLADRLGERFELFMDVDIAPGLHFGQALTEAVAGCDVMLVLIGRSWLEAMDEDGRKRLLDPRDWVVQEIEAALARDVTVIPVLVDGARMPTPAELPERLESLGFRQAVSLRHESFASDITTLVTAIEQSVPTGAGSGPGAAPDRQMEQRLVDAWRQLRGESLGSTATRAPASSPDAAVPAPASASTRRVLAIVTVVSYLVLVLSSLPLNSPSRLATYPLPRILLVGATLGVTAYLVAVTRSYAERRSLWASAGLWALVAVPVGVALAVVTRNVSSFEMNALFWLLLYAVAMVPGAVAFAMLRERHGTAALGPAVLAYLVAVCSLLVSAVLLP